MNRKTVLTIKLVVLIVLFLLVGAVSWRVITRGWGGIRMFGGTGELIASETFQSVDTVNVDIQSYSVEVQTHSEPDVRVEIYRGGWSTSNDPQISLRDSTVQVTQKSVIGFNLGGGGRVLIYVPADGAMDYSLRSVSGSIRLDAPGKTVSLSSVSGSIRGDGGGDAISAKTVSGSVRVFDAYETVVCESTSGSIRTTADADTQSITASSVSGSVRVRMDGVTGYRMRYSTVSSSVKDEYHGLRYEKRGESVWGDEHLSLDLHSTSGSIKLEDWSD